LVFVATLAWLGLGLALVFTNRDAPGGFDPFALVGSAGLAATSTIGWIILRRTGNPIGWIFAAFGLGMALIVSLGEVLVASASRPEPLPLIEGVAIVYNLAGLLMVMPLAVLFLLFPTGASPSPRWRWVLRAWAVGAAMLLVWGIFRPGELWGDPRFPGEGVANPIGVGASRVLLVVGGTIVFAVAVAGIVSLALRYRRARGEERQQMRWVVVVAGTGLAVLLIGFAQNLIGTALGVDEANPPAWFEMVSNAGWLIVSMLVLIGLPASVAIGVLRYRLYDIDVVIKKTVVFTVVAAVLTVMYLGVIALATVGTVSRVLVGLVLLAVTFNPVRHAARSLADRIVYGKRATSYEVLADFSERMGETYATDDVLPRMAQILAGATGASAATVWLRIGSELQPAEVSGEPIMRPETARLRGDELPLLPDDFAVEVRHQGDLLGALSVTMPANDPIDPGREKLVGDLASQAGLVLRNVRLIEELKASRQRLVAAQDQERRKLERNLHDGAQQQLVALAVKQRLLGGLIGRDDEKANAIVAQLADDTNDAIENLRDLARGIYPPLLADKGLVAALEAQARKAAVPTTVQGDGVGRYPQELEAAVYFCTLEALNNVAKYADASRASIALTQQDGYLTFIVTDDGRGFETEVTGYGTGLQGMADRLDAIGGSLDIRSDPGGGTTVTGRVPAREMESAAR
jgi:signal transduction histidine kinase